VTCKRISIFKSFAKSGGIFPSYVFITPPWLSFAHSLKQKEMKNQKRLERFISEVSDFLKDRPNINMINFNELTRNLANMDGVHYSYNVNKVLLTIYLNGLI